MYTLPSPLKAENYSFLFVCFPLSQEERDFSAVHTYTFSVYGVMK